MKLTNMFKSVGTGAVLSLGLTLLPSVLPAAAQTSTGSDNPVVDTTPFQESRNDSNNWGWLGLIGLVGLANLLRKNDSVDRYNDPATTTRLNDPR